MQVAHIITHDRTSNKFKLLQNPFMSDSTSSTDSNSDFALQPTTYSLIDIRKWGEALFPFSFRHLPSPNEIKYRVSRFHRISVTHHPLAIRGGSLEYNGVKKEVEVHAEVNGKDFFTTDDGEPISRTQNGKIEFYEP